MTQVSQISEFDPGSSPTARHPLRQSQCQRLVDQTSASHPPPQRELRATFSLCSLTVLDET